MAPIFPSRVSGFQDSVALLRFGCWTPSVPTRVWGSETDSPRSLFREFKVCHPSSAFAVSGLGFASHQSSVLKKGVLEQVCPLSGFLFATHHRFLGLSHQSSMV